MPRLRSRPCPGGLSTGSTGIRRVPGTIWFHRVADAGCTRLWPTGVRPGVPAVRLGGGPVVWLGLAERSGCGRGGQRSRADEPAALRAGFHREVQGAALQVLVPWQEPLGPAVVPLAGLRAARDRDRVPGDLHLVVDLGVRRRHVHAAVTDVGEALLAHRPVGVVQVIAGPGEPYRPGHLDVVAGPLHVHRVALVDREVGPVRGVVTGPPRADRPVVDQLPVPVEVHVVGRGAGDHDQRAADVERLGQRVVAVDARSALDAVEVAGERDLRVRRPVTARPEVKALHGPAHAAAVVVPVPGADDRLGRLDLQRALDRGLVGDLPAEAEDDRHANAVGLVVALEDRGRECLRRRQSAERACPADRPARAGRRRGDRIALHTPSAQVLCQAVRAALKLPATWVPPACAVTLLSFPWLAVTLMPAPGLALRAPLPGLIVSCGPDVEASCCARAATWPAGEDDLPLPELPPAEQAVASSPSAAQIAAAARAWLLRALTAARRTLDLPLRVSPAGGRRVQASACGVAGVLPSARPAPSWVVISGEVSRCVRCFGPAPSEPPAAAPDGPARRPTSHSMPAGRGRRIRSLPAPSSICPASSAAAVLPCPRRRCRSANAAMAPSAAMATAVHGT